MDTKELAKWVAQPMIENNNKMNTEFIGRLAFSIYLTLCFPQLFNEPRHK